jgi:hypothetical protein
LLRGGPGGSIESVAGTELTRKERAVLDFERSWWQRPGEETKAAAIRRLLSLSSSRYYELLDALCDSPHALAYDPLGVRRLRRRRTARRAARLLGRPLPSRSRHR